MKKYVLLTLMILNCLIAMEPEKPETNKLYDYNSFDPVHEMKHYGKDVRVAFVESAFTPNIQKIPLIGKEITRETFSKAPYVLDELEYDERTHYTEEEIHNLNVANYNKKNVMQAKIKNCKLHDAQVIACFVSAAPLAKMTQYDFSILSYNACKTGFNDTFRTLGNCLYSLTELKELLICDKEDGVIVGFKEDEKFDQRIPNEEVIDQSLWQALYAALNSDDVRIINISQFTGGLCGFTGGKNNRFEIPPKILDYVEKFLIAKDKILVMTPGNSPNKEEQENVDLNLEISSGYDCNCSLIHREIINGYLNSWTSRPEIAKRLIIPINVVRDKNKKINFYSAGSNCPLNNKWGESAICAIGTNIDYGSNVESGTSLAAPYISALAALCDESSSGKLKSYEIVELIRNNATHLGDPKIFGPYGLINPLKTINALLGLDQTSKNWCNLI